MKTNKEVVENEMDLDKDTVEEVIMGKCSECGSEHLFTEMHDNGNDLVCENCL
ncbi:MAG TPA: hypothetical protein QF720_02685 [Nitrospinota bacterium]|jgi:hypothetical protein|nr:hypothetical protein [Nitrospinota bacterium]|tara:strand:- start:42901 stop:43059 length:159 start_codon:yes stop_codon:yes gene_type:complete